MEGLVKDYKVLLAKKYNYYKYVTKFSIDYSLIGIHWEMKQKKHTRRQKFWLIKMWLEQSVQMNLAVTLTSMLTY